MLSHYDIFCKVLETGSFTRAADLLGYSQSAVSQAVKGLERELGTTLVNRNKGGITPTADGESYLPYIRAISGAERTLDRKRQEMQGLENNTIRIGTFTTVSRNLLPQLMQRFKALYPGVHFALQQGDYTSINQWVQEGIIDFGFTNRQTAAGLTAQTLYQDEMVAVLPRGHALAARPQVLLRQLAEEPFILLDEGADSVPLNAFSEQGLSPKIEYKVYDDYSILAMVRQGLGVSVLYRLVLPGFGEGVAVRPIREAPERTVALAWRSWETMPLAARRFAEFIIRHAPEVLAELLPECSARI
ncbi:DNA-binding transcriptional regulator, LysR family [Oscillibacter sp. PC13]|uniref:LysR family transcriptional regulator n=1 Tax=Oscillibacter sp. PC13 TaxID=1855299 RepID=UPI0008F03150|nr:LysR family transcriptional regulator [Oscillibacter sp. PC13]SFP27277.1 DNA-binding transcriptional regulator, LysR family [Oscillibacter sp. PC13]